VFSRTDNGELAELFNVARSTVYRALERAKQGASRQRATAPTVNRR
jgi:hypothetical protein